MDIWAFGCHCKISSCFLVILWIQNGRLFVSWKCFQCPVSKNKKEFWYINTSYQISKNPAGGRAFLFSVLAPGGFYIIPNLVLLWLFQNMAMVVIHQWKAIFVLIQKLLGNANCQRCSQNTSDCPFYHSIGIYKL